MEEKVLSIIDILKTRSPDPVCALHYSKDYELMIAVRLSAQCTDARVNLVPPALFAAYPTLEAMAAAPIDHIEELVHSCGFYKHKARDIVLACQMLINDYKGKVPDTMEDLLKLPGVGRKTANLLLGDLYQVPGSVVCDTHCIRICARLGLTQGKSRKRWKSSFVLFFLPKKVPISATGLSCSAGTSAPPVAPNVVNAPCLPCVKKSIPKYSNPPWAA